MVSRNARSSNGDAVCVDDQECDESRILRQLLHGLVHLRLRALSALPRHRPLVAQPHRLRRHGRQGV
eukprot:403561-Hanusia_phi.AAC.1